MPEQSNVLIRATISAACTEASKSICHFLKDTIQTHPAIHVLKREIKILLAFLENPNMEPITDLIYERARIVDCYARMERNMSPPRVERELNMQMNNERSSIITHLERDLCLIAKYMPQPTTTSYTPAGSQPGYLIHQELHYHGHMQPTNPSYLSYPQFR